MLVRVTGSALRDSPWQAPEIIGGSEVTTESDVYAMGHLIYEVFGGALHTPRQASRWVSR